MTELTKEATATTPEVHLDPKGQGSFSGKSMMENALEFYADIHQWIDTYLASGATTITLDFDFVYFNSTSAKQILKMLMLMDDAEIDCTVNWKHPEGHDILKFRGTELESMLNMDFNYVAT